MHGTKISAEPKVCALGSPQNTSVYLLVSQRYHNVFAVELYRYGVVFYDATEIVPFGFPRTPSASEQKIALDVERSLVGRTTLFDRPIGLQSK